MNEFKATATFSNWLSNLDKSVLAIVLMRLDRAKHGHFGDAKTLQDGVCEMRIHIHGGYRIYYARHGKVTYFLLAGGNKSTQAKDIKQAVKLWQTI